MIDLQDYLQTTRLTVSSDVFKLSPLAAEAAFSEVYGEESELEKNDLIVALLQELWDTMDAGRIEMPVPLDPKDVADKAIIVRAHLQKSIDNFLGYELDFASDDNIAVKLYRDSLCMINIGLRNYHSGDNSIYISKSNSYRNLAKVYDWLHENKALIEGNINMSVYDCGSVKCIIGWISTMPEFKDNLPRFETHEHPFCLIKYAEIAGDIFGIKYLSVDWDYLFAPMNDNNFDHFMRRFEMVIADCDVIYQPRKTYTLKVEMKG